LALWPVIEDLNGCDGVHQTSLVRPSARGPSASTAAGNRIALAIVAAFG
jgi:hypothetical protein